MPNGEEKIRQLVSTWLSATESGDDETVLSAISDDSAFTIPGQPMVHKRDVPEAPSALSVAAVTQFAGRSDIQEMMVPGNGVLLRGRLAVYLTPPGGGRRIKPVGRTLSGFRKRKGQWRRGRGARLLAPISDNGE